MSIADDPSSWTTKPKDNTMSTALRTHTLDDYHRLRDALLEIYAYTSGPAIRRMVRTALNASPAERPEVDLS